MGSKVQWNGYLPIEIFQAVEKLRIEKGWSKTFMTEQAFKLLVEWTEESEDEIAIGEVRLIGNKRYIQKETKKGNLAWVLQE